MTNRYNLKNSARAFAGALALFSALTVSAVARADVLTLDSSGKSLNGIALSKGGTAAVDNRQISLTTVGAGLRSKKVGFVPVKVYVAQLLVSNADQLVRTDAGALDSVAAMDGVAFRLDFLRTVDADTVQSSFRDSLTANQVDLSRPEIKAFLDGVSAGGDAISGKNLTLVLSKAAGGQEAVTYQDANGKVTTTTGPAGFIRELSSIWLGSPADSGVADLKAALLAGGV